MPQIWNRLQRIKVKDNVCDLCRNHKVFKTIPPIAGVTNRQWRLCAGCLSVNQHILFNKHTTPLISAVNTIRKMLFPDEALTNDEGNIEKSEFFTPVSKKKQAKNIDFAV
jgi:hypothetical protein